jgi:hypothetical protein
MKAKADAMLKKGLISEKQHARMSKGWTSAKIAKEPDADDKGKDTAKADDPSGKYRKRGSDKEMLANASTRMTDHGNELERQEHYKKGIGNATPRHSPIQGRAVYQHNVSCNRYQWQTLAN